MEESNMQCYISYITSTLASSTTKTVRHDIAEILLKVALNTKNQSIIWNMFLRYAGREPMPYW
jgi:hypothetical protein